MKKFILRSLFLLLWIIMILFIGTSIIEKNESNNIKSSTNIEIKVENNKVIVPESSKPAIANYHFTNFYLSVKTILYFLIPISFLYFKVPHLIITKENSYIEIFELFIIYSIYDTVLSLPVSFFSGFYRSHLMNTSQVSFSQWFRGIGIDLLISIPISVITFSIAYIIFKKSRKYIFIFAIFTFLLGIASAYAVPVLIDPLLNDFTPINDKLLQSKLESLCIKSGVGKINILKVNKSKSTNMLNAYMTGIGKNKRIVLWDTAIKELNSDEIISIAAHEIGHYKMNHIIKGIILNTIETFFIVLLCDKVIFHINKKYKINSNYKSNKMIPLFITAYIVISFFTKPIDNYITRSMEREADKFAVTVTNDSVINGKLQCKLMEKNLGVADVNKFIKIFYYDHPTTRERIESFNEYNHHK